MDWNCRDAGVVVEVDGEIDLTTVTPLESYLGQVAKSAGPGRPLVLDLRGVQFLSMAGLRALAGIRVLCAQLGAEMIVVAEHPAVRRPIELADLDAVLTLKSQLPGVSECN